MASYEEASERLRQEKYQGDYEKMPDWLRSDTVIWPEPKILVSLARLRLGSPLACACASAPGSGLALPLVGS